MNILERIYLKQTLINEYKDIEKKGYLFIEGIVPTKIKEEDLPEYYVKINIGNLIGYLNTKGVKYLQLNRKKNTIVLYISYDDQIIYDNETKHYHGFDYVVQQENIDDVLRYVEKYSYIDVTFIRAQLEEYR